MEAGAKGEPIFIKTFRKRVPENKFETSKMSASTDAFAPKGLWGEIFGGGIGGGKARS